jgi:polyhydroxyalkanoate synthesis regulator protein
LITTLSEDFAMHRSTNANDGLLPEHSAPQHARAPRPLPLFLELVREVSERDPELARAALAGLRAYEEARGATMLPINFLKQLIGLYGNSMQNFVPSYLEAAMDAFQRNQSGVKDTFGGNMFADLAKRNMAMFEDAAHAFTGKPKSEAKPSTSDVEQLKAELAALQAKVDRLSR